MKKVILAAVLAGISSTAAWAADLGAAVPPVPVQVYNWSGFYVGGDLGVAGVKQNTVSNFVQGSTDTVHGNNTTNEQPNPIANTPFVGGGYAGVNWQFAPSFVMGLEGDWQSVRSNFSFCRQTSSDSDPCSDNFRGFSTVGGNVDWVATARGRLGWVSGPILLYGTAGVAFADVKTSLGLSCERDGCGEDDFHALSTSGISSTHKIGWVAGAGIEWMFAQNWILRGEWQHIDLGSVSSALSPSAALSPDCSCTLSATQKINLDILRAGVSFKFGG
jgi:outer membrane immunogenic protein